MSFRPSRPAFIVTGIALFAVAAGAAYAASAKPAGRGTSTASSLATATSIKPGSFFHSSELGLTNGAGCIEVAQPPAGQALIVTQVRVDVYQDPTPGNANNVAIHGTASCTEIVGDVNPATIGQTIVTFDPGLGIPAGSGLSVAAGGGVQAEVYVDGYLVPAKQVPATITTGGSKGVPQQ